MSSDRLRWLKHRNVCAKCRKLDTIKRKGWSGAGIYRNYCRLQQHNFPPYLNTMHVRKHCCTALGTGVQAQICLLNIDHNLWEGLESFIKISPNSKTTQKDYPKMFRYRNRYMYCSSFSSSGETVNSDAHFWLAVSICNSHYMHNFAKMFTEY